MDKNGVRVSWKVLLYLFRSENNVKNKFYSSLRKLVRKMNKTRKIFFFFYTKEIKFESVSRVLDAP
mgnify:CR=1 FL=1